MDEKKRPAVHILASQRNGTLYIGMTSDLIKRIWEHRNDVVEGFTRKYRVHTLVYYEQHSTMEAAITREKRLKKMGSRLEVASDRRAQSTVARFVAGNLRIAPSASFPHKREFSAVRLDARLRGHDGITARYALEGLPNTVLAAEYQTMLPPEKTAGGGTIEDAAQAGGSRCGAVG